MCVCVVGVIARESGDTIVSVRRREEHVGRVWCGCVECWPRRRELSQRDAQGGIQRANGLAVTVVPLIYSRIFSRMFTPHSCARTTLLSASPSARHSTRAGPAFRLLVVARTAAWQRCGNAESRDGARMRRALFSSGRCSGVRTKSMAPKWSPTTYVLGAPEERTHLGIAWWQLNGRPT